MYSYDFRREFAKYDLTEKEKSIKWASESRQKVLAEPKFQELFAKYADAIGINECPEMPSWVAVQAKMDKQDAEREARRLEEERQR